MVCLVTCSPNVSLYYFRGYYPKGGGEVFVKVYPCKSLTPVTMMDSGKVKIVKGRAFVAGVLPKRVRINPLYTNEFFQLV